jgi:hypothetical protein
MTITFGLIDAEEFFFLFCAMSVLL